jgi:hypothetical protein
VYIGLVTYLYHQPGQHILLQEVVRTTSKQGFTVDSPLNPQPIPAYGICIMALSVFKCLKCFHSLRRKRPEVTIARSVSYENELGLHSVLSLEKDSSKFGHESVIAETPEALHNATFTPRFNPALLVTNKGQYEIREAYPFPSLNHEGEVIIQTKVVGLNPIDWKSVDYGFCLPEFPWITGREMAGVVEKVGSEVTNLKVGQRVWTSRLWSSQCISISANSDLKAPTTKTVAQDVSSILLLFLNIPSSQFQQL